MRSQMIRRPWRVSKSSISSTWSQCGNDVGGKAACCDGGGLLPQLLAQAAQEAVDLPGVAEHDARLDRLERAAPDGRPWPREAHAGQRGGALAERLESRSRFRRDHPAEVFALSRDDVVVDGRAEVDCDARAADAVVGGHGVRQPVGAELPRVVDADGHAGANRGTDESAVALEVPRAHLVVLLRERRHDARHDHGLDVREPQLAERQQRVVDQRQLIGGGGARGVEAPVLE